MGVSAGHAYTENQPLHGGATPSPGAGAMTSAPLGSLSSPRQQCFQSGVRGMGVGEGEWTAVRNPSL